MKFELVWVGSKHFLQVDKNTSIVVKCDYTDCKKGCFQVVYYVDGFDSDKGYFYSPTYKTDKEAKKEATNLYNDNQYHVKNNWNYRYFKGEKNEIT